MQLGINPVPIIALTNTIYHYRFIGNGKLQIVVGQNIG